MDRTLRYGGPEEAGMSPERIANVRRLCAGWVEHGITPSLQVLVARRGVIVLHEAWGRLGPESDAPPLGVDAIFGLGSITKPITAAAVMCLVEDGLLGLNRPVQEYVPEFIGEGKEAVMVHHLLTHTSGLLDDDLRSFALAKIRAGEIAPPEPVAYLEPDAFLLARCFDAIHAAPLWKAPGVEMSYCVYGYRLLAEIVTRVAGRQVERFVQDRIFDPLGMASTSYIGLPREKLNRLVRRADDAPWAISNRPDLLAALASGNASAYSTALDLAAFGQMFLNRGAYGGARVLSLASVAEMTRDQVPALPARYRGESFREAGWGLGWSVLGDKKPERDGSLQSRRTFSHSGAGGVCLWADPAHEIVGVFLSVVLQMLPHGPYGWNLDLFMNAVTATVFD